MKIKFLVQVSHIVEVTLPSHLEEEQVSKFSQVVHETEANAADIKNLASLVGGSTTVEKTKHRIERVPFSGMGPARDRMVHKP